MTRTDLSVKMHAMADLGHARAAELRAKADEFDRRTAELDGDLQRTKRMVGAWARARRVWEECCPP